MLAPPHTTHDIHACLRRMRLTTVAAVDVVVSDSVAAVVAAGCDVVAGVGADLSISLEKRGR